MQSNSETVAWMSGLVTGLQNQAQRFESACDLNNFSSPIKTWLAIIVFYRGPILAIRIRPFSGYNVKKNTELIAHWEKNYNFAFTKVFCL